MNQFWNYEHIFGRAEIAHLERTMKEFYELAATVRRKLGKQSYLLDEYISKILEGMNKTLLSEAVDAGFMASSELQKLCISVMDGKTDCTDNSMCEKVKEYIDSHRLNYQEQATTLDLYCVALHSGFIEYATDQYRQRQKDAQTKKRVGFRKYTETWLGRRRALQGITSTNWNVKAFAQRCALNTPIQGTAADILKLALGRIVRGLPERPWLCPLMQIHDELVFEIPENEIKNAVAFIKDCMEMKPFDAFSMPIIAEASVGYRFGEMKELDGYE